VFGPEQFGDGCPTGKSFPDAHEWGQSAQKRLVLVCGYSLEILESCRGNSPTMRVVGVLHLVSEPTLVVTRACAGYVRGHVAHRGTWVGTRRMDVSKRESSWTWGDQRGRRSSMGVSM
jgi:hypothetical protein